MMEFFQTDSQALLVQIRRQEDLLKSKRRWLLGLPTSSGHKYSDHLDFLNKRNLPESLLREDDVFYENVKTRVEEAFGALNVETRHLGIRADRILDTCKVRKLILSCLNDLSTRGLYLLAIILTEDSVKLEKTRWKLKRVIREFTPKVLRRKSQDCHQLEIVKRLSQLLNDPKNFRRRCSATTLTSSSPSFHDAASQVLYRLGDLPTQGLLAMHRKLEGVRVMPQIKRHRHGWGRDRLINILTKISKKMLSSLGEEDELQESLAKAMAVAELSLKLVPGRHNLSIIEFYPFSPQIKTLHNEIVKAIWFVRKQGNFQKLKQLKSLLDPDAKMSNRSLRTAIKKMLIDYLFECSDMDTVPKSLLKALAIVNADSRSAPHSISSQDEIEEEVECLFSLSAQMKQVVWDLLPNCDFEHNFADAYMEELEESDDDFDDNDNDSCDGLPREDYGSHSVYVEGMGESMPANLDHSSVGNVLSPCQASLKNEDVEPFQCSEPMHFTREGSLDSSSNYRPSFMESKVQKDSYNLSSNQQVGKKDTVSAPHHRDDSPYSKFTSNILLDKSTISDTAKTPCLSSFNMSCAMPQMEPSKPSTLKNQYLVVQEACDENSMIAYNFIGRLLEEFAKSEGVALDWCANLYLSSNCSIEEDLPEVEQTHIKAKGSDSVIIQVCEELIPSLSKSGTKRLQQLLGL